MVGGGGTGASTGTGSVPNTGGLPPTGGETLGFPNRFPFPQQNIWDVFLPGGMRCDFGVCVPTGNGFTAAAAAPICVIAPEACILVGVAATAYVVAVYWPQIVHMARKVAPPREWSDYPACNQQYERDRAVCQQKRTSTCWESAAERLATCNASRGTRFGEPPLRW